MLLNQKVEGAIKFLLDVKGGQENFPCFCVGLHIFLGKFEIPSAPVGFILYDTSHKSKRGPSVSLASGKSDKAGSFTSTYSK